MRCVNFAFTGERRSYNVCRFFVPNAALNHEQAEKRITALIGAGYVPTANGLMLTASATSNFNGTFKMKLAEFKVNGGSDWYVSNGGFGIRYSFSAASGETLTINYTAKPVTRDFIFENCTYILARPRPYTISPADDAETHPEYENVFNCNLTYTDKDYNSVDFRNAEQTISNYFTDDVVYVTVSADRDICDNMNITVSEDALGSAGEDSGVEIGEKLITGKKE
ncbi:hypothetical protein SAMN02910447_02650 [Ruminococcus sp. YE71]|uniref:hypothetical protein n=1 Tax=unclassified Ruminococcus TaxID=2608920 RepID=UPI0008852F8C|nr:MULTISPECIES: hypothetical protein [unclassified Ruminococcus]SDA24701.1 hypothetical protein SAMN02910446_02410 [Ruminococcus sp. YE78]SFW43696.1 hypothetical protein SAMN02910447_02650 [Ruminococcus sp. YE71]